MKLYGYSERGLVNGLCYDLAHRPDGNANLGELLRLSQFRWLNGIEKPDFTKITDATLLVDQSLSDFGESDLIVLCDLKNGDKAIVFCEFKLRYDWKLWREWEKFIKGLKSKTRKNLTSNLFCQLYFKQRFCQALANSENIREGLEFDEPLKISGGNDRRKIGTNPTIEKAVEMIRPYAKNAKTAYFLMVVPKTPDQEFPDITKVDYLRLWTTQCWGHLSLPVIFRFCQEHCPSFVHTLSIFKFNRKQLAPTE